MTRVSEITIDLGEGVELKLTLEQAKKLFGVLNELLGKTVVERHIPAPPWPTYPRYIIQEDRELPCQPRPLETPAEHWVWCQQGNKA